VLERIAQRFPSLQLVVDHLGIFDVAMLDRTMRGTWDGIDGLFGLAAYPNVAVKLTSVPYISRDPYPYADAWPHIHAVIDAFGVDRLMWGSDAFIFGFPYDESIEFIRASDALAADEKAMILGGALRRVMRWPAPD
jgi:L-fuconolactonase